MEIEDSCNPLSLIIIIDVHIKILENEIVLIIMTYDKI